MSYEFSVLPSEFMLHLMTIRCMFSRFDECDVSPLTVKALSEAGYVQMTRVQEATLSVCLDGKFTLFTCALATLVALMCFNVFI